MTEIPCSQARDFISARIDDELGTEDGSTLDHHVAGCAACAEFQDDGFALRRALRMRAVETEAPESPLDLVGSLRGLSALRWALFVIGGTLVVLNVPSIISVDGSTAAHLDRHDGVFGTALGVGMLAVAAKPHRAIGLVPITGATAILMLVVAVTDILGGNANVLAEAIHIVQFAGLICLWVISGGPTRLPNHVAALRRSLPLRANA